VKPYSISRRLITTVLLLELVSAICAAGFALIYERHTRFHSFEVMLRGRADSLLGAVQDAEDPQDNVMLDGTEASLPSEDIYEVRDANNRILGRSHNWSGPTPAQYQPAADGTFRLKLNGQSYRVLRLHGLRMVDPGDKGGGVPRHVTILYGAPIGRVWDAIFRAVAYYSLTSLLLLLITGALMYWLLRRGLAPLRELAAEASTISVTSWNFAPSEHARNTEELAPLASAIETTLHGLERSFHQQRHFVSDSAHELKTATAVVKSSLQLLAMKPRTLAEYQLGLEKCHADCARVEEIVAKMLTLARAESEPPADSHASPIQTNLSQCVQQVSEQFESMAEVHRLRIIVSTPSSVLVDLDAEQCLLLCSNLLMNALQHSPADSEIHAIVERHGDTAELRIEDHGDGIEAEALPYIFDRFYRGDPSRSRKTGGTGLGLTICKAITDRIHGDITLTSQPGIGTAVIVRLPASTRQLANTSSV
jgi:signal transduction histidine kinase